MIKKILKKQGNMKVMIAAWLVLIWIRAFIGTAVGETREGVLSISLMSVAITLGYGFILYLGGQEVRLFYEEDSPAKLTGKNDEENEENLQENSIEEMDRLTPGLRVSQRIVLALTMFFLLSFVSLSCSGCIDLFTDNEKMRIGLWYIEKKAVYSILTLIVYPVWTTFIIRRIWKSLRVKTLF